MAVDLGWLAERLQLWAEAHYGEHARATGLETMPGHAGLSFGFTIEHGEARDELVMRVPPKGVRRKGNTDVIRQVLLLLRAVIDYWVDRLDAPRPAEVEVQDIPIA